MTCLAKQDWEQLGLTEDTNQMAHKFSVALENAINKCVPLKQTIIKPGKMQGLSMEARNLIRARDRARINKVDETIPKT